MIEDIFYKCLAMGIILLTIRACHPAHASMPFTLGIPPLDKAFEAGYIQTGADKTVNGVQGYLVDNYAKPWSLDKLVAHYFVYRKRQVTFRIWGGSSLKLQPDRFTLSIPF